MNRFLGFAVLCYAPHRFARNDDDGVTPAWADLHGMKTAWAQPVLRPAGPTCRGWLWSGWHGHTGRGYVDDGNTIYRKPLDCRPSEEDN